MDDQPPPIAGAASSNVPEYSVSELSGAVKRTIEGAFGRLRVRGEVTECRPYPSGHIYLSLKDEGAKLGAVIWKSTLPRLGLRPENGVEVIATGRLTTYGERSSYQLVIERLEYAGAGAMLARVELLRRRLAAEGLFDPARKRVRPLLPEVVGVVTSESGAVLRDIVTTIARRFPRRVVVWPVPVQGLDAAARIAAAITGFGRLAQGGVVPRPDVLIVARGGGSLEDLMAFNDEAVVRAAAASPIPLISAVGHETDTTLIDHAADIRAPTPTAAAELAVPERRALAEAFLQLAARLAGAAGQTLQRDRLLLERLGRGLPDLPGLLGTARQRLDDRAHRMDLALPNLVAARRAALVRAERGLPDLPALLEAGRRASGGLGHRLELPWPSLVAARRAALVRAERGLPDLPALLAAAQHRLADRGHRLELAWPNLVAARRAALLQAARGMPDLRAIGRHARQGLSSIAARLPAALPALLARRRGNLALEAAHLRSALRHAVATKAAEAGRVLPRLSPGLPQARLREARARLEGLSARLESVSHRAVLARGYAVVFDAAAHPVTKAAAVKANAELRIRFADGDVAVRAAKAKTSQRSLL